MDSFSFTTCTKIVQRVAAPEIENIIRQSISSLAFSLFHPTKIVKMLKNYWLIAVRKMWKHKAHALLNVLGLTIGLSSCLIIFLITNYELSFDRFHPNGNRIYRVVTDLKRSSGNGAMGAVPGPLARTLRNEVSGCEAVSGFLTMRSKVIIPAWGAQKEKEFDAPSGNTPSPIIIADPQYFQIFHYNWLAGNPAASLNDPYRVVLSAREVNLYFGNISPREAIGREVIYSDSLRTYVSGVVEDWDKNTDLIFRDFISYRTAGNSFIGRGYNLDNWGGIGSYSQAFVLLAKGTTPTQVERQLPAFVRNHFLLPPGASDSLVLQPLADLHFSASYHDGYSRQASLGTLYSLMGIAVFILLLALVNFVNLSTAQSMQRIREVGIRKVLGSLRRDIIAQFLGETFVLTLLSVIVTLLITPPLMGLLHDFMPPGLQFGLSGSTLLFLFGITVVTSLLAGFYPAKVISALLPVLSLKGQASRGMQPNRLLQRGLLVFQFTISLVFIIGTVIVTRQLHYVLNKDLGFDKDAIFTFQVNGSATKKEVLAQEIRSISGVAMVSRDDQTPQSGFAMQTSFAGRGPEHDTVEVATGQQGDTNYLRLFGIPLVAGRNFFANDSVNEYVVNETMVRKLGFRRPQEALGQLVEPGMTFGPRSALGTIVGVVRDYNSSNLYAAMQPLFINYNSNGDIISVRLAPEVREPEAVAAILSQLQKRWRAIYPDEKFSYTFFDDDIARSYQQEQHLSTLTRMAMIIAISLSCLGLLALATFSAEQRQKEIGIRKVVGANVERIFVMLTVDFLWPVALAFVIAAPVAWYFTHGWLQNFEYRTTAPWWIFGLCGLAAMAIALVTVGIQTLRAAVANPVKSLRTD